jgi:hypothetical protein
MSHATRILESAGLANAAPKHGDIRVWWIPQIPGKAFTVDVGSARNPADLLFAKRLLTILAAYDFFQLENRIKPDFSNAGGLTAFDALMDAGTEWCDWHDEDGRDFDEVAEDDIRAGLKWEGDCGSL